MPGHVVGVDVSERVLERARQVTAAERLGNVRYEVGVRANIAAALRPRARLVLLVWQRLEDNEWARVIDAALGDTAQPPPRGADPFSLGDADATARILERAGFAGIRFEDVHEPVVYGHDPDAALAFVKGFQNTNAALATLSDDEAARTVEQLSETLAAHYNEERGVVLDARSWLITARRRR